jgi:hypothetical protein
MLVTVPADAELSTVKYRVLTLPGPMVSGEKLLEKPGWAEAAVAELRAIVQSRRASRLSRRREGVWVRLKVVLRESSRRVEGRESMEPLSLAFCPEAVEGSGGQRAPRGIDFELAASRAPTL